MKRIFIIFVGALFLFTLFYYVHHPIGKKAIINGHEIRLFVAVTESEKEKGLGHRGSLPVDTGMLFVYQNKDRYGFWMKGMRFPLDFIWIDDNTIVDISQDVPNPASPTEQPVSLAPKVPVNKVLEVNAGVIESLGIRVGDPVRFTN